MSESEVNWAEYRLRPCAVPVRAEQTQIVHGLCVCDARCDLLIAVSIGARPTHPACSTSIVSALLLVAMATAGRSCRAN